MKSLLGENKPWAKMSLRLRPFNSRRGAVYNYQCGITDYPFGSECDKNWYVLVNDNNNWTNDQSITLECKDKGI